MIDKKQTVILGELLEKAGYPRDFTLQPVAAGGNNRVYRLIADGNSFLLKIYFHHPQDPRDRLSTEYNFVKFAWDRGIRCVPRPFGCDHKFHLALYEFIEGSPLEPEQVDKPVIKQALDFFEGLNRFKQSAEAAHLRQASEACFSVEQHLNSARWRLEKLRRIEVTTSIDKKAARFVRNELIPAWESLEEQVLTGAGKLNLSPEQEIPHSLRCLSPSDFGFHNAIITETGVVRFVDFEYAGWDDPAKMVCDFFLHPMVPVSMEHFDWFANVVANKFPEPKLNMERYELLIPVHRLKWCCLMMNEFLAVGMERRSFANKRIDKEELKFQQLEKAQRAFTNFKPMEVT